jgi:hypothetical protein
MITMSACSSEATPAGSSGGATIEQDSGQAATDAAMTLETGVVDAGKDAAKAKNCPRCNAAGYACVAPAAGGSVQLTSMEQADGSCKLNGKVTLQCGGMGVGADGSSLPWVEGADGTLQLGTGNSQLQCTPK